jgi:4-hydroxy-2-oxoglutarate aldolase
MANSLNGIFAPVTTPFDNAGSLEYEHLTANIRKYAQTGLQGFLILGSNGENKSLTVAEKEKVIKTVITHKAPRQTAMVGSIFESTKETIDFALCAQEAGADYITLLPPSYFKSAMKDAVLIKYLTDVASSLKIPCLIYKAPQFSGGVDISITVIKECAGHPNIAGIKDSSSSGIEKILFEVSEDFTVLSGSSNTFLSAMFAGAKGGVLSLANYLPEQAVSLYQNIVSNNLRETIRLNQAILRCNMSVAGTYGVAGVKYAMDCTGYHGDFPRLPLPPITEEGKVLIQNALKHFISSALCSR